MFFLSNALSQVHHSENQAAFVRRWLTTAGFKPVVPMYMHKFGKFSFHNFTFLKDAFTTLNLLACPAIEPFTLATKVPKGKTISIIPADSSRLEYQARSNVVHVATNRKPYLDEKKKVIMHAFYYYFLRRSTQTKNPQL